MKPVTLTCLGFLFGVFLSNSTFGFQPAAKENDAKKPTDSFDKIFEQTAEFYSLRFDGKNLIGEFPKVDDGPTVVANVGKVIGSRGSGSSRGTNSWAQSVRADSFDLSFGQGRRSTIDHRSMNTNDYLSCVEFELPLRTVSYELGENNSLEVIRFGGLKGDLVKLIQRNNGEIVFLSIPEFKEENSNDQPVLIGAKSMSQLWEKFPELVDNQMVESLVRLGFSAPPSRMSDEIMNLLLARLNMTGDRWQSFLELAKNLESQQFATRQKTAKQIEDEFDNWRSEIQIAIESSELGVATRAELKKIFTKKSDKRSQQLSSLVEKMELLDQPSVLERLLNKADDNSSNAVIAQLKKVTGKDFGEDRQVWLDFLQKELAQPMDQAIDIFPMPDDRLIDGDSHFQFAAKEIARLIHIAVDDEGRLHLNQNAWQNYFGGKSVDQLKDEVVNELELRQIPISWLKDEIISSSELCRYEHLLFDALNVRLKQLAPPTDERTRIVHRSVVETGFNVNRTIVNDEYQLKLRMNNERENSFQMPPPKAKFFSFNLKEFKRNENELWVIDDWNGNFRLTLLLNSKATIIDLIQTESKRCRLTYIDSTKVHSKSFESFDELWKSESEFFKLQILPLFTTFGIDVSDKIGGPLNHMSEKEPRKE